jgi:hypothetical protein
MTWEGDPPRYGDDQKVGYGSPPVATRFKKGQPSPNPAGRPKRRRFQAPHATLFEGMITIRDRGVERQVTVVEAFLRRLKQLALKQGSGPAARAYRALMTMARRLRPAQVSRKTETILLCDAGNLSLALQPLRMAKILDAYRETARMVIEPWLVQAALARLDRKLSPTEQRIVVDATRTPHKVRWPEWWREFPK